MDGVYKPPAEGFECKRPGAVEGFAGAGVGFDVGVADLSECDGGGGGVEYALGVARCDDAMPSDEFGGVSALLFPACDGVFCGEGFSLELAVEEEHGVAADDHVCGEFGGYGFGFGLAEGEYLGFGRRVAHGG